MGFFSLKRVVFIVLLLAVAGGAYWKYGPEAASRAEEPKAEGKGKGKGGGKGAFAKGSGVAPVVVAEDVRLLALVVRLLHAERDEHDRVLEALGFVDRHDRDCLRGQGQLGGDRGIEPVAITYIGEEGIESGTAVDVRESADEVEEHREAVVS